MCSLSVKDDKLISCIHEYRLKPNFELRGENIMLFSPKSQLNSDIVNVEFWKCTGNFYKLLDFEEDYVEMEEYVKLNKGDKEDRTAKKYKETLDFVSKFRRDQKRRKYTKEEFNNNFERLSCEDEIFLEILYSIYDTKIEYIHPRYQVSLFKGVELISTIPLDEHFKNKIRNLINETIIK